MSTNTTERRVALLRALEALRDAPADARQQSYDRILPLLYQLLVELEQVESTGVDITPDPEPEDFNAEVQLIENVSEHLSEQVLGQVRRFLRANQLALIWGFDGVPLNVTPLAGWMNEAALTRLTEMVSPPSWLMQSAPCSSCRPSQPLKPVATGSADGARTTPAIPLAH